MDDTLHGLTGQLLPRIVVMFVLIVSIGSYNPSLYADGMSCRILGVGRVVHMMGGPLGCSALRGGHWVFCLPVPLVARSLDRAARAGFQVAD